MNKTQCPHCFKVYIISDEQYNESDGIVCCGSCDQEFYASFLNETIEVPNYTDNDVDNTQPLRSRLRPPNYGFDESVNSEISIRFDDDDSESIIDTKDFEERPSFGPSQYSLKLNEPKEVQPFVLTDTIDEAEKDDVYQAMKLSFEELVSQTDIHLIDEVDQLIEDKIIASPLAAEVADQIEDISTNEMDSSERDVSDIPEGKFKIRRPKVKLFRTFFLTPLTLALVISLSGVLLYQLWLKQIIFWPDQPLVQRLIAPLSKPVKQQLEKYNVVLPERRNLNGFQLLAADVEPHTTRASTILLRVSLINRAKITQALPTLELSLTDADGRLVSRRSLNPESYLHNNRTKNAIGANELKKVTIELLAFPKQATGYELRILGEPAE